VYEWFERGAHMTVDESGSTAVSTNSAWPQRCPRVSREDLDDVSRYWRPILEQLDELPTTYLRFMADPDIFNDGWRPDGPLLELSFGTPSESVGLLWDGKSSLPQSLDTAVMGTLEMFCSNSRLAEKYLLRDLPSQVASRLECQQ
jgi:hypothetical protein